MEEQKNEVVEEYLTVEEVSKKFRVSSGALRNAIKRGELNAVKIGHIYRLPSKNLFPSSGVCQSTTLNSAQA